MNKRRRRTVFWVLVALALIVKQQYRSDLFIIGGQPLHTGADNAALRLE